MYFWPPCNFFVFFLFIYGLGSFRIVIVLCYGVSECSSSSIMFAYIVACSVQNSYKILKSKRTCRFIRKKIEGRGKKTLTLFSVLICHLSRMAHT